VDPNEAEREDIEMEKEIKQIEEDNKKDLIRLNREMASVYKKEANDIHLQLANTSNLISLDTQIELNTRAGQLRLKAQQSENECERLLRAKNVSSSDIKKEEDGMEKEIKRIENNGKKRLESLAGEKEKERVRVRERQENERKRQDDERERQKVLRKAEIAANLAARSADMVAAAQGYANATVLAMSAQDPAMAEICAINSLGQADSLEKRAGATTDRGGELDEASLRMVDAANEAAHEAMMAAGLPSVARPRRGGVGVDVGAGAGNSTGQGGVRGNSENVSPSGNVNASNQNIPTSLGSSPNSTRGSSLPSAGSTSNSSPSSPTRMERATISLDEIQGDYYRRNGVGGGGGGVADGRMRVALERARNISSSPGERVRQYTEAILEGTRAGTSRRELLGFAIEMEAAREEQEAMRRRIEAIRRDWLEHGGDGGGGGGAEGRMNDALEQARNQTRTPYDRVYWYREAIRAALTTGENDNVLAGFVIEMRALEQPAAQEEERRRQEDERVREREREMIGGGGGGCGSTYGRSVGARVGDSNRQGGGGGRGADRGFGATSQQFQSLPAGVTIPPSSTQGGSTSSPSSPGSSPNSTRGSSLPSAGSTSNSSPSSPARMVENEDTVKRRSGVGGGGVAEDGNESEENESEEEESNSRPSSPQATHAVQMVMMNIGMAKNKGTKMSKGELVMCYKNVLYWAGRVEGRNDKVAKAVTKANKELERLIGSVVVYPPVMAGAVPSGTVYNNTYNNNMIGANSFGQTLNPYGGMGGGPGYQQLSPTGQAGYPAPSGQTVNPYGGMGGGPTYSALPTSALSSSSTNSAQVHTPTAPTFASGGMGAGPRYPSFNPSPSPQGYNPTLPNSSGFGVQQYSQQSQPGYPPVSNFSFPSFIPPPLAPQRTKWQEVVDLIQNAKNAYDQGRLQDAASFCLSAAKIATETGNPSWADTFKEAAAKVTEKVWTIPLPLPLG
jgi:hypothetical protein